MKNKSKSKKRHEIFKFNCKIKLIKNKKRFDRK